MREKGTTAAEWASLLVAGVAVRLMHVWQWEESAFGEVAVGDAARYAGAGVGDGGWTSQLYAGMCAAVGVGDTGLWLIRLIQVGLGGLSCVLVWSIGRRLFSPKVGRWAGVAAVVYGPAIYYGGELTAAALAVFLGLLLLWGLVGSVGIGSSGYGPMGIGMGITAATTGLADYRGWLVAIAALGWMVKGDTGRRMGWWFLAGTALVLAPAAAVWGWQGLVPAFDGVEPVEMARRAYLFWHGAEVVGDIDPYRAASPSWVLAPLMWRAAVGFPFGLVGPLALVGFLAVARREWASRDRALPLLFAGVWMAGSVFDEVSGRTRLSAAFFVLPCAVAAVPLLMGRGRRVLGPGAARVAVAFVLLVTNLPVATARASSSHDTWTGYAYRELGMDANAIGAYERAIESDEAGVRPYEELAGLYFETGAYGHAAEVYRSLVRRYGGDRAVRVAMAECYLRAGRAGEAAEIYAELVAQEEQPTLAGRLGDARVSQGSLQSAISAYRKLLAVWPDSHRVRYRLALAWEQRSVLDSAAAHYEVLARVGDWERTVGWRLAQVLARMEVVDFPRIEALLGGVLANHPDSAPAVLCMAFLLHRTGRDEEALVHLQSLQKMFPEEYRIYAVLEEVYEAMERHEEADRADELYRETRSRRQVDRRVRGDLEVLLQDLQRQMGG